MRCGRVAAGAGAAVGSSLLYGIVFIWKIRAGTQPVNPVTQNYLLRSSITDDDVWHLLGRNVGPSLRQGAGAREKRGGPVRIQLHPGCSYKVSGGSNPSTGFKAHRQALPGTRCDDGDSNTFGDVCDGKGGCAGTPSLADLPPISTAWWPGPSITNIRKGFLLLDAISDAEISGQQGMSTIPNLGDELGPLLLSLLSGRTVVNSLSQVQSGAHGTAWMTSAPDYLVIGTVLDDFTIHHRFSQANSRHGERHNISAWGCGSRCSHAGCWDHVGTPGSVSCMNYLAFRGPLSRQMCMLAGCGCPAVFGDPALLLPFFHQPAQALSSAMVPTLAVCIIPHADEYFPHSSALSWLAALGIQGLKGSKDNHKGEVLYYPPYDHADGMNSSAASSRVRFIDIRTRDYAAFIDALALCPWVASSSLHGLILAEAYGIPWLRIRFHGPKLNHPESHQKYDDFALSVGHMPTSLTNDGDDATPVLQEFSETELERLLELQGEADEAFKHRGTNISFMETKQNNGRKEALSPVVGKTSLRALVAACPFCHPRVRARLQRAFDAITS